MGKRQSLQAATGDCQSLPASDRKYLIYKVKLANFETVQRPR